MMKIQAIKFILAGKAACFRKPDVNEKVYFTYNNIHKVALLGLLGAILGLKGYRNHEVFGEKKTAFPEFYEKLCALKVAIKPNAERGYFTKKTQYFNNSVGYASQEEGGNLMVYEQWVENPSWTIYLAQGKVDAELWGRLVTSLHNQQCVYIPYLGKNDFQAIISGVEECELVPVAGGSLFVHSLFAGEVADLDDFTTSDGKLPFIFSEYSPVALREEHNFYKLARLIYTNCEVSHSGKDLVCDQEKTICFL
jgi:CRISPR-associated protein Cas5h